MSCVGIVEHVIGFLDLVDVTYANTDPGGQFYYSNAPLLYGGVF